MSLAQICLLLLTLWPQQPDKPLPDQAGFMAEFRKTVRPDSSLLRQYTYTEKETEFTLDSKGKTKKTEINVYQVVHGAEEWQTYRRQIVRNGVDLTEKELEKQDRDERERVEKESRKRASRSEAKRRQEKDKADREEREAIDDLFGMFEYQLVQRETIEGTATIVVTFKPKVNFKPKTRIGKILYHLSGR